MERRRELGQEWSDLLMKGMVPANDSLDRPRRAPKSPEQFEGCATAA